MKYQTIIFDLDGTLLNTIDDLTNSLNKAFSDFGYPGTFTTDDMKNLVGGGSRNLIEKSAKKFNIDEAKQEEIFNHYSDIYSKNCLVLTKPFPEVVSTLNMLKELGVKIGVISNKPDISVQKCVNHYFENTFDFVTGKVEGINTKPNPDIFNYLAKKYKFEAKSTLYVGDMIYDILFAKNCCLDVALCSFGFGKIEELKDYNYRFDKMSDLLEVIR